MTVFRKFVCILPPKINCKLNKKWVLCSSTKIKTEPINKRCWSGSEGEFCGDDYGGEIIMVKGLRIANRILVGLLGGSGAKDCGGSVWWAVGFWR